MKENNKMSRPNRRAARRLADKTKAYELMVKADMDHGGNGKGFTKPGALKKW